MTSVLERRFFETFNIKPHMRYSPKNCACGCHDCKNCEKYKQKFAQVYPQITDKHYLELIWLLSKVHTKPITPDFEFYSVMDVKSEILNNCIEAYDFTDPNEFIKQVRQLFKGE